MRRAKPCPRRTAADTRDLFNSAIYSTGINWGSLSAGVTPIGMVVGRPAGVQIIGRRYREDMVLDAMEVIESRGALEKRRLAAVSLSHPPGCRYGVFQMWLVR